MNKLESLSAAQVELGNAKKFLAMSLSAFANKQYEEAGALFAQAAESESAPALVNALLETIPGPAAPGNALVEGQPVPAAALIGTKAPGDSVEDEAGVDGAAPTAGVVEVDKEEEVDEEDASVPAATDGNVGSQTAPPQGVDGTAVAPNAVASESSGQPRRKVTSLAQIGAIIASAMEATASEQDENDGDLESDSSEDEDDEDFDDEDTDYEVDPDFPGQPLVRESFSSDTVLEDTGVKSPIRLKQ